MHDWNIDGEITPGDMAVEHLVIQTLTETSRQNRKPFPYKSTNKDTPKATEKLIKDYMMIYVRKPLLTKAYIDCDDVSTIRKYLCSHFRNLEIYLEPDKHGYPRMRIKIKAMLLSSELCYEIRNKGKRNK